MFMAHLHLFFSLWLYAKQTQAGLDTLYQANLEAVNKTQISDVLDTILMTRLYHQQDCSSQITSDSFNSSTCNTDKPDLLYTIEKDLL